MHILLNAFLILWLVVAPLAASRQSATANDLLEAVVFRPDLVHVSLNHYPTAVRARFRQYAARYRALERADRGRHGDRARDLEMVHRAWLAYQHHLAAFGGGAGSNALAREYVEGLRPCYEWEGYHDCPEREAEYAEAYLASTPEAPFAPALPLLAAHRWLCAAEGYAYEHDAAGERSARAGYERMLTAARKSRDAMIRAAADALAVRGTCRQ